MDEEENTQILKIDKIDKIDKSQNIITSLYEKYKEDEYMLQRIHNHIVNYLPKILENELINHKKRIIRNTYLTSEQQLFIKIFLNKNQYYYLSSNNCFYEYNGTNYSIIKEDDIIHKLLSSISTDRILLQRKYQTKINIFKQIKDRHLFHSIPETVTIQNIINNLYPSIFSTKNQAKYFLTIMGDNIFKKNNSTIFLISHKMKKFILELDTIAYYFIGNNTCHNFMTKYHENHSFVNCRLIKINENYSNDIWKHFLRNYGLDLLCVSAYYSKRYENSDNFVDNSDEELKSYVYYLKNITHQVLVDNFCYKCIQPLNQMGETNDNIDWKNVHFIWKQYLSSFSLPNIIYSNTLKTILKEKYNYDEPTDSFINITSKYLPIHSNFIQFWEKTIHYSENETELFNDELELDELCSLFKFWSKQNDQKLIVGSINEETILKILMHFFPTIKIVDDKYILNISCNLWNKNNDIKNSFLDNLALPFLKVEKVKNIDLALPFLKVEKVDKVESFDDCYKYYYEYCKLKSIKFIVNKLYFEKYINFYLKENIVFEKFIKFSTLSTFGKG